MNVDTDKLMSIYKSMNIEIEKYNELIKKFYSITDSLESNGIWLGTASKNYQKYLNNRKGNYNTLYKNLYSLNQSLKYSIVELETAISNSKVSKDD